VGWWDHTCGGGTQGAGFARALMSVHWRSYHGSYYLKKQSWGVEARVQAMGFSERKLTPVATASFHHVPLAPVHPQKGVPIAMGNGYAAPDKRVCRGAGNAGPGGQGGETAPEEGTAPIHT